MTALVYVTGATAAGKTSVRHELVRRGYEGHDGDTEELTLWLDRETRQPAQCPPSAERPPGWFERHVYELSCERVETLAARALDRPGFLCGVAYNDLDLADLFGAVVCLTLDELAHVLAYFEPTQEKHRRFGSVMVDARQPLDRVVDEIEAIGLAASRPGGEAEPGRR